MRLIVDAHEDLAMNMAFLQRDYSRSSAYTRQQEAGTWKEERAGQAMLGWEDWLAGNVALVFATLFVPPASERLAQLGLQGYKNPEEAHTLTMAQLTAYQQLVVEHADKFRLVTTQVELEAVLTGWHADHSAARRVGLVLLMEGAEGVRNPAELPTWFAGGVRIIGPAWQSNRYTGGTDEPGPLTELGQALLAQMSELNLILDLSHMAEEATQMALAEFSGVVIASHSNARALLPTHYPDRHLSDETIRQIGARQGVIGVVLANPFLDDTIRWEDKRAGKFVPVSLEAVSTQIDYMCQLLGSAAHVGLGSDFEGGFGAEFTPVAFDTVADLPRIGEALDKRGYNAADVAGILGGNWLTLLRRALPAG